MRFSFCDNNGAGFGSLLRQNLLLKIVKIPIDVIQC